MRFFLHRSVRKALPKTKKNSESSVIVGASRNESASDGTVRRNSVASPIGGGSSSSNDQRHFRWGQQCSPSCGCVVRFEAKVDPSSQRYESIGYTARQVVTHSSSNNSSSNNRILLTARGRPMLKECQCKTLHHLAAEATHHFQGKTTHQVKNMLEFNATRSSKAFRTTALATQGLPSKDTGCFDVMEEALTAMVKGYMPPLRQDYLTISAAESVPPNQNQLEHPDQRVTTIKGMGYHQWTKQQQRHNEVDDHSLDFAKFWHDNNELVPKLSNSMSTLAMFDLSMSMIAGGGRSSSNVHDDEYVDGTSSSRKLPKDWQDYVDQLYEEDEQQSA